MNLNREEIQKYLPHRDPFLFVDEVFYLEKGESIKAKVTFKDDSFFFKGHFPGRPIVPGVIIVESMAQVGGILIYKSFEDSSLGKDPALVGINNVRFKAPTLPNDTLIIEASLVKKKLNIFKISTKAFKDDKLIVEADITATVLS
jgi:beta-hydroxyacyl-ACP dehydratase FabZ|tara:strand:- start:473 stop:907 length:435 start_codon:yes stop_codon:yes gene_type:complete